MLRFGGTLAVSQDGRIFFGGGSRSDLWVTEDVCSSWFMLSAAVGPVDRTFRPWTTYFVHVGDSLVAIDQERVYVSL